MPQTAEKVVEVELNRLRGRLCGLIESWGLPEVQERGMKSTLKYLTYDSEKTIREAISNPGSDE
ncbi:hypothetical protein [Candidatus Solirubrobacter pratensis]|uniref:hypothetical protein n=1 Tax=Candidatus Solirubrobacter pratensis TaxID=1298857 RepID=UPI000484ACD9|nr:hypothetical protein [Candidatus Solirubrobacter pratensis]